MTAYYNEFEPYAVQWLKNLIDNKLIAHGDVDDRSITDVKPHELKGYTQCHFFAGIGGWSLALRLAGWSDDVPVWTGSCPCQSFSTAGKQKGKSDERHLWPVWQQLIAECKPSTVFGEQVANAITHGWLDEVAADMERQGYEIGAAVLPACSVNAPHRRDRLWFVANTQCERQPGSRTLGKSISSETCRHRQTDRLGNDCTGHWNGSEWIHCPDGKARLIKPGIRLLAHGIPARVGALKGYGNAIVPQVAAEFIGAFMECRP